MDALRTGLSALTTYQRWIDTAAHNLANLQTARPPGQPPVRPQVVVNQELGAPAGSPAGVQGVVLETGDPAGVPVHQPDSPVADARGTVRYPDTDVAQQLGTMITGGLGYQAGLASMSRAIEAYDSVIRLGRSG